MELPTIATNWSGNVQFMNEENSFLIDVESMVDSSTDNTGHKWAKPSVASLSRLMRYVYDHRNIEVRHKAKKARQDVLDNYSQRGVAMEILRQLQDIKLYRFEAGKQENEKLQSFEDDVSTNFWDSSGSSNWGSTWNSGGSRYQQPDLPAGWNRIKIVED